MGQSERQKCRVCHGEGSVAIPYRPYDPRRACTCERCHGSGDEPSAAMLNLRERGSGYDYEVGG